MLEEAKALWAVVPLMMNVDIKLNGQIYEKVDNFK
jgi:hypothetical protein